MKLSISNIAWDKIHDDEMYAFLKQQGFHGLEIAPTRIFPDNPYEHLDEAKAFSEMLESKYSLVIPSMQSIWFGKTESIFGTIDEHNSLLEYTRKAVDFAAVIGSRNLVFGNPKNRNKPDDADISLVYDFFSEATLYAKKQRTNIAIEPNPVIYGTNFLNYTVEAFEFAKQIEGLLVNLDIGTIIENSEDLQPITDSFNLINHVHISEPYLEKIIERHLHKELIQILKQAGYDKYVSIEMKNPGNLETVKETVEYVRRIFHEI